MKWNDYDSVYFLGIGGIGMSAIARWFLKKGWRVGGYDRTSTTLTSELAAAGMEIGFEDEVSKLPPWLSPDRTLIVFTPAIPKDHRQHARLRADGYTIKKRAEVLGLLTQNYQTVAVAGTHGKTTTSSLIAHILKEAGIPMVAFLGGIATNYDSNLVMQGDINEGTWMVVEADEFDRSFLHLRPQMAVVTSADADHLDIYGDHSQMLVSFRQFIGQIKKGGTLIIHESIAHLADALVDGEKETYGMSRGQFFAGPIVPIGRDGLFEFDLMGGSQPIEKIQLGVPGFHNMENAIAAIRIAQRLGIREEVIRQGLASFRGVKRRFEFVVRTPRVVYIDDYAHHPTEIEAFLHSVRSLYPGRRLTVVFQPHLFTRTRDFASGFSKSLSLADDVILMDIYPARELPIEGVTSDMLMGGITSPVKIRVSKSSVVSTLEALELDIVATVGAGDIDTFVVPIKKMIETRYT